MNSVGCEQTIQHSARNVGKTYKSKCGKQSSFVDEIQRSLCGKHFRKWFKRKYKQDYDTFINQSNIES